MDLFYCQFNILSGKSPLRHRMNTFFDYDLYNISEYVCQLRFSFLIAYLQLSSFKNNFNDVPLGLVGEELIKVSLLGDGTM